MKTVRAIPAKKPVGAVAIEHQGNITTTGEGAHGILAQSAGGQGFGGNVGIVFNGQIKTAAADTFGILANSAGLGGEGNISMDVGGMVEGGSGQGAANVRRLRT